MHACATNHCTLESLHALLLCPWPSQSPQQSLLQLHCFAVWLQRVACPHLNVAGVVAQPRQGQAQVAVAADLVHLAGHPAPRCLRGRPLPSLELQALPQVSSSQHDTRSGQVCTDTSSRQGCVA